MIRWRIACLALALSTAGLALAGCGTSVHDMVARGDMDALRSVLEADPARTDDRDQLDKTPLHRAVHCKRIGMMALLVACGADVKATDVTGMTPLHSAALLGRKDEAAWLLEHGADLEARDRFGDTPLHTAALFGHGHVVKLFHDRGAGLDVKNNSGKTPLALAIENRQDRAAQYIRKLGSQGFG